MLLTLVTLLLVSLGQVLAADRPLKPLRFMITPVVGLGRSQAPQAFEIWLECNPNKLFEGRLELKSYIGTRLIHEYLSQELTVTEAGLRVRIMLPSVIRYSAKTTLLSYARFISERETIDLGEVDLAIPAIAKRNFVIANVQPEELLLPEPRKTLAAPFIKGIPENVGLEQFNPQLGLQSDMITYTARLAPEGMPVLAASYSSFDLLVLESAGFQKLRRGQLSAIADWVAAGGSVIVSSRAGLTANHVEFLNRLSGSSTSQDGGGRQAEAVYASDDQGRLVVNGLSRTAGQKTRTLSCRAGAGRHRA